VPTIFLIFLAVPLVEIFLLIKVGNVIGAPWTIALVVLTALVGAWLVRLQGLSALNRVRQSAARGELPALELLEGLFLLAAGALLLTPGFFTDIVGFACLTPPLRRSLIRLAVRRFGPIYPGSTSVNSSPGKSSIETDYHRLDD
jgi:UPF0716 protein FxsA